MKYHCTECNYSTEFSSNWCRHNKSKIHIKKSDKSDNKLYQAPRSSLKLPDALENKKIIEFICEYCGGKYSKQSNLTRHISICTLKQNGSNETIKKLEMKNKFIKLKKENEMLKKENMLLAKENEFHKQLVISAGNVIQSSMSTVNYLILNCNNAPLLEPLKDYSILEEKEKFISNIIYHYKENKIDQYLGNFLVKQYKTKDPAKRSNWNSDTSRLTYINRELVNNKPNWVIDKKGVKMTEIIIDPYVRYIKNLCQKKFDEIKKEFTSDVDTTKNIFEKMTILTGIIQNINNKSLSNNINKYLAPHFYFDKNNGLVLVD